MSTYSVPYFMGDRLTELAVPGPHRLIDPTLPEGSQQRRMAVLYRHLAAAVADDEQPVVWAGDCVSSIGVIAGLQRQRVRPTLVWFDAHGDFNTWDTTPSGFIGGMPLAMIVGRGEQTIVEGVGMKPLAEGDVVLVDGRDLDPEESAQVAASDLTVLSVDEVAGWQPPPTALYVHVDVDVVDPTEMPAMNYPASNGPSLAAVRGALSHLAANAPVVAFSMSLWNPELAGADAAAAACVTLAETLAP